MIRNHRICRRQILKIAAAAAAAPAIVPASVLGENAPSKQIIMGSIGVGWQGGSNLEAFLRERDCRVVAIADVLGDWREELITSAPGELRIYGTTIPAADRRSTLMQDPIYRTDVAISFMGYYAAPMLSYDLASRAATSRQAGKKRD